MANIFLSVPVLGKPELKMIYSMYQSILSCTNHKIRIYFNENDSLISRVRNVHLSTWYNEFPEYEYFVSLDSDLEIINAYPNNNLFTKLLSHDVEFCGGLYAIKKPGPRRCSSISTSGGIPEFDSGLAEMLWLSTGCWCIKRSVVDKMIKAYPELIYDGDDNASGKTIYGLYIPMIYEVTPENHPGVDRSYKKYLSEDWSFCARWKKIGGKIHADTSIVLKHLGQASYTIWDVDVVKTERPQPPAPGYDLEK